MLHYHLELQKKPPNHLTGYGVPIANKNASLTAGLRGPLLLQDSVFIDEFKHFDREIIPERTVHAKGAGKYQFIHPKYFINIIK